MRFPPVSRWIFVFIRKKTGEAGLFSLSKKPVIARSEATRQSVSFFGKGRIPTPVTRSLARNDGEWDGGAMWASPPTKSQEACTKGGQSRPPLRLSKKSIRSFSNFNSLFCPLQAHDRFDCCFSFQGKFFHFLAINRHREVEYNLLYPASVFSLFREHLNSLDKGFHKLFLFCFRCGMVDFIKCQ